MHHACKHEDMMVGGAGLGNISFIQFLRTALRRAVRTPARDFPMLWKKVIDSGSHYSDHLTPANVLRLDDELKRLRKVDFAKPTGKRDEAACIEQFRETLAAIVQTAIKIKKPVAF